MGGHQQVAEFTEAVGVMAYGALLTMQRRWMGNGDVIVVEGVVVGDFPVAFQQLTVASHLNQRLPPGLIDLLM